MPVAAGLRWALHDLLHRLRRQGVGRVTGSRLALIAVTGLLLWVLLIGTIGLVVHAIAGLIS